MRLTTSTDKVHELRLNRFGSGF